MHTTVLLHYLTPPTGSFKRQAMLRITLLCLALVVFGTGVTAQDADNGKQKNSFLIVQGGLAIPLADFASNDLTNENAGMAKTGFSTSIQYNYCIQKNFGILLQGHYANLGMNDAFSKNLPGATVDHWQYTGLVVGPMLLLPVNDHMLFDVHVASGVMWVNSPRVKYQGQIIVDEDWGTGVPVQTGLQFRYITNNNLVLFAGGNYLYMKPEFRIATTDPPEVMQKINTLHFQLGIGYHF